MDITPTPPRSGEPPPAPAPPSPAELENTARILSARLEQERRAKRAALATNLKLLDQVRAAEAAAAAAAITPSPALEAELADAHATAQREAAARASAQAALKTEAAKVAALQAALDRNKRKLDATRAAYQGAVKGAASPRPPPGSRPSPRAPRVKRSAVVAARTPGGSERERETTFLTAVPDDGGGRNGPSRSPGGGGGGGGDRGSAEQLAFLLDREAEARARDAELIAELRVQRDAARKAAAAVKARLALLTAPLFEKYLDAVTAAAVSQAASLAPHVPADAHALLTTLLSHLDTAGRVVARALADLPPPHHP